MTKLFLFNNPSKNHNEIYKFVSHLMDYSISQQVRDNRFNCLIKEVNLNFVKPKLETHGQEEAGRRSYFTMNDLHQDLIECECDEYMQVKSGSVKGRFEIKT